MGNNADMPGIRLPFSESQIPADAFARMREENLTRWPTGGEIDLDEAVAFHQSLPDHKQLAKVIRQADKEGRCLTQPRG